MAIAAVWIINGLYCKVYNGVPRHQQIVARILGADYAGILTRTIGWLEVLMAVWVLSNIKSRWCAVSQIFLVFAMNVIEFLVVPDLLLFGRMNIVVATFFIFIIYWNQFGFYRTNTNC
ncbi:DoxX-like family protein [Chitinophaga varians]|uniref:DoxX-like family protein n=1 Tax=Chitinophaga varians TaxID=2202339 RepID=UPI001FE86032|nr:DoxX-like family protein [Chitinophaga varians]